MAIEEQRRRLCRLETLARRREALGEGTIREAESEWPELIAAGRAASYSSS